MRSTSSAHSLLSSFLCLLLVFEWTFAPALVAAGSIEETCLLLKFRSPSVPEDLARHWLDPMQRVLRKNLHVRWAPARTFLRTEGSSRDPVPEPDDAAIERISGKIAAAIRSMDSMDTRKAAVLLDEAKAETRKFRIQKNLRPFLSEILLRRGLLFLWEGDRKSAEEMFSRSRLLRPDFSPDPALFSPTFRQSWERAGERDPPDPEILVHSLPPGATVILNGEPAGFTPGRFKVRACEPVRIRVTLAGYQEMERTGQWLPGDFEELRWNLARDRIATLEEILVSSPDGKGSGGLLAEMAESAGASRVALLVLERSKGITFLKVLSSGKDGANPALLGEIRLPSDGGTPEEAAEQVTDLFAEAGWPSKKEEGQETESPWYHKKWFWILFGAIAIGAAAAASGGGDGGGSGSGGSTGTIGVTF